MVKYGIAPVIKQAFEEVFKAPFIVKILLAELGQKAGKDSFLTINYDGTFEEGSHCAVLAAAPAIEQEMVAYLRQQPVGSLEQAVGAAARTWAIGDRAQRQATEEAAEHGEGKAGSVPQSRDAAVLYAHLRQHVAEKTIECAVLDRQLPGSSKFRAMASDELGRFLPKEMIASLT